MYQTSPKGVKGETQLSGGGDLLKIVEETDIWSYTQLVHSQSRIHAEESDAQFRDLEISPKLG